jgi:hypothetical protein
LQSRQASQIFEAEGDFSAEKTRNFGKYENSKELSISKEYYIILINQLEAVFNKINTYCNHINYLSHYIMSVF